MHDIAAVNKQVKDKSFFYRLTLYTHHYSEKDTQSENNYDCKQPLFKDRQNVCLNLNLQNQFFRLQLAKSTLVLLKIYRNCGTRRL